ncbi:MAG: DNA mismatch repair endonuclease MutL [Bacteriovoracaceae bacterium]|nr:DNA mismatch repair endonuclease MutL [Bacteriovoracaceae bacterium]
MEHSPLPDIQLLDHHVIDQIKAGEVIERPANIIKELIENSLDAGATEITLHIKNSGLEQIYIEDNGHGMRFEQLPLAFTRHATSKLYRYEDLSRLATFGFRGEALASLSSVAKVQCFSKPVNGNAGRLQIAGDKILSHTQDDSIFKVGTQILIRELFFNTPARFKFISSSRTEKNQIQKVIASYLLINPQVCFNIKWDDEDSEFYPKVNSVLERMAILSGKKNDDFLLSTKSYGNLTINFILSKSCNKGRKQQQVIFVNKRPIYDNKIQAIIGQVTSAFWQEGSGDYLIAIESLPAEIDVNIHPHKTKIKFENLSHLLGLLTAGLKDMIKPALTPISIQPTPIQPTFFKTEMSEAPRDLKVAEPEVMTSLPLENSFQVKRYFDQDILLIERNNDYSLLSLKNIFSDFLLQLTEPSQWLEEQPLLISLPINLPTQNLKKHAEELEAEKFIIDILNESSALVRTIPSYLTLTNYHDFLEKMLTAWSPTKTDNFREFFITYLNKATDIQVQPQVLQILSADFLYQSKALKPINHSSYQLLS